MFNNFSAETMAINQETVFREHPCFGACKNRKGRIHLPVAPGCNIECRFCDRRINEDAQVPGNTSKVIKPEEALETMLWWSENPGKVFRILVEF